MYSQLTAGSIFTNPVVFCVNDNDIIEDMVVY